MPDGEAKHPYPSIQRINLRHEVSPPPANTKKRRRPSKWELLYIVPGLIVLLVIPLCVTVWMYWQEIPKVPPINWVMAAPLALLAVFAFYADRDR